ncbi:MAG: biopolymer transporter ExbD [Bacteroidales bacterium]|nr:biopolymer transporter ExbD [Bacteroidales bacterium]MCF8344809.1 biopolymer transporter ExbD [Bacteroidales bacterium]MCF8352572.1 biopolymer transporter ExbD [Bacteroidales bacterium]MCF8377628.1 biopolymer transporter ExbD [Bacteroidales bacterium]MCF8402028.1 biopolymer transporter ExbD [Bacteroidales bacterium]
MARKVPEVNAGSMADIAFLLLIFFLVTTTMDVDTGIIRQLPPPLEDPEQEPPKVKERNIMNILINSSDRLLVNNERGDISTLREEVKDFMAIHPEGEMRTEEHPYPEVEEAEIEVDGAPMMIKKSKGVISLKNDRGTSYEMYIAVQNELTAAFHELRDRLSQELFGRKYNDLVLEDRKKAIENAIPLRISEAEPVNIGGN